VDFDSLASKFFVAAGSARDAIYKEAITLASELGPASRHYLRVMEKIANGTEDYVAKESKRSVFFVLPCARTVFYSMMPYFLFL